MLLRTVKEFFSKRSLLWPSVMIYLLLLILLPERSLYWDSECWKRWCRHIFEHGLNSAYDYYGLNYLPGYLYILDIFGRISGNEADIGKNIYLLKAFTLVFDIGGILLAIKIAGKNYRKELLLIYGLFNIGYLYNTIIWNQVDAIFTFFAFASIAAIYYRKLSLSMICFILALNFKLQAIIFLPLIGLLWLPQINENLLKAIKSIVFAVLAQIIVVLPWLMNGSLKFAWQVAVGSVGFYPTVSMNAFNMWHLFLDGDLMTMPDTLKFGGLTYKSWGLIIFMLTSLAALWPLLKSTFLNLKKRTVFNPDLNQILIIGSLIPLLFFFFNTQMHERYCHPAILFLTAYAFNSKRWTALIIVSLAYVLNLEKVMMYLQLYNYNTLIFMPEFIAVLFLTGIAICFTIYTERICLKRITVSRISS